MSTKGRAVLAAYQDTGALAVSCGHCTARPGNPCTKADGRISRVPCFGRLADAGLMPPGVVGEYQNSHDFSEARHPREDRA